MFILWVNLHLNMFHRMNSNASRAKRQQALGTDTEIGDVLVFMKCTGNPKHLHGQLSFDILHL